MDEELSPSSCLLCLQERPRWVKAFDVEQILTKWRIDFDLDVSAEFNSGGGFALYHCDRCNLDFFYPPVVGSDRFYSELQQFDWYYMREKWEFQEALRDIKLGSQVLEIGCGEGSFIRLANDRGVRIEGIELNEQAVRSARAEGLPVTKQDLIDLADAHPGTYDVVCSFQVLEHIADPGEFLDACVRLIGTGGRLIISVPNNDSFIRYEVMDLLNLPPHHLTRWNVQALEYLACLMPLKLVRKKIEPLASYHQDWYVSVQKRRIPDHMPFGRLLQRSFGMIFDSILEPSGLARRIHGHTIYTCFQKI